MYMKKIYNLYIFPYTICLFLYCLFYNQIRLVQFVNHKPINLCSNIIFDRGYVGAGRHFSA